MHCGLVIGRSECKAHQLGHLVLYPFSFFPWEVVSVFQGLQDLEDGIADKIIHDRARARTGATRGFAVVGFLFRTGLPNLIRFSEGFSEQTEIVESKSVSLDITQSSEGVSG